VVKKPNVLVATDSVVHSDKVFFSTSTPKNIFGEIIDYLQSNGGKDFIITDDKWQL
jgi:hypothetical protein